MTNQLTITLVVVFLGLYAFLGLAGVIWLQHDGIDPTVVVGLAGPAVGAIAALLATTRVNPPPNPPQPPDPS